MCGIGGFWGLNNSEDATKLFASISDRGKHACGFAVSWPQLREPSLPILVMKRPFSSTKWLNNSKALPFNRLDSVLMCHTRYATKGDKYNMDNNHPIIYGKTILTHNGMLRNDDEIFKTLGCERIGQVDSEALAAAIELKGIDWAVQNCVGSMSIAWMNQDKPTELNFFTNGLNPLCFGIYDDETVVYASWPHHLKAIGKKIEWYYAQTGVHYTVKEGNIFMRDIEGNWSDPMLEQNGVY
mgnify:CR=1 FL=1|tara:strand:+ start:33 stop:752 length:720 start_codon:yes stop_codon:yes gene_type:complete